MPAVFSYVLNREVIETDRYSGRLQSPQEVNLSARVSGIITSASFDEGAIVKAGDLLFSIDDRPFKADLQSREADIAYAKSQLSLADVRFKRYDKLSKTGAVSAENFDEAAAAVDQAKSRIAAAEAARDLAKLNLEWTQVRSPIDGKVSRKFVTEGNLVNGGTGQSTPLTVITSVDPMHCYVTVPERALLRYTNLINERKNAGIGDMLPCAVQLENGKGFKHKGVIDFVDNRIDRNTGTVEMRCSLPNPEGKLLSGLFARMQVPGTAPYHAMLIPDIAVGTDQDTRFVLTVGADDAVVRKAVVLGASFGSLRAVSQGLNGDERVIVTGLQFMRPGAKVKPEEKPISAEDQALLDEAISQFAASAAPHQSSSRQSLGEGGATDTAQNTTKG